MFRVRPATTEEAKNILEREFAAGHGLELTERAILVVFENAKGEAQDYAVLRTALEIEPVGFAPESSTSRRFNFIQNLETFARLSGIPEYYFSIVPDDVEWQKTVEKFGAERISNPVLRYRKNLR